MQETENKLANLTNVHVLLAEDDPIQSMIAEKLLLAKNAIVKKAVNGHEVLQILNENFKPNIILLDLEMPEMDGFTTIKKIKEQFPHIPVLALTAHVIDRPMYASLLEHGFADSISRPYKPELFYSKILLPLKRENT